ncbi:MAG: ATP-binding protein [Chloroflexi bacterium OHK40]
MNPFTERTRITDPARFTGRWRELGMVFEQLERRRPVLVTGSPGTGKSSLLTHVAQSAAAVLEMPDLPSFFLDLAVLPDAATAYRLLTRELGSQGTTATDVEAALARSGRSAILCLDNAQAALAAGWGQDLLERLARLARRSLPLSPGAMAGTERFDMLLVAAAGEPAPLLSEPFAVVRLGAIAPAEVRLLTEAYLDETGVAFSQGELRELAALSAGHPAYLQRAAYHLFEAKVDAGYDWRAAYLAEASERPVPGAPLPPEAFLGTGEAARDEGRIGELAPTGTRGAAEAMSAGGLGGLVAAALPLVIALVVLRISGNWLLTLGLLVAGYLLVAALPRGGWPR